MACFVGGVFPRVLVALWHMYMSMCMSMCMYMCGWRVWSLVGRPTCNQKGVV